MTTTIENPRLSPRETLEKARRYFAAGLPGSPEIDGALSTQMVHDLDAAIAALPSPKLADLPDCPGVWLARFPIGKTPWEPIIIVESADHPGVLVERCYSAQEKLPTKRRGGWYGPISSVVCPPESEVQT